MAEKRTPTPTKVTLGFEAPNDMDYWDEHPDYPSEDWQYEVVNGDTRQSYWEWVYNKIVAEDDS